MVSPRVLISVGAPLLFLMLAVLITSCSTDDADDSVARLGDRRLMRAEVEEALATMPAGLDSLEASRQFIEGWVTNELLARESQKQGLMNDPEVKSMLAENTRSVLISALLEKISGEEIPDPGPAEITAYFEANRERLALREDYLRVRYLQAPNRNSAEAARRELSRAIQRPNRADSLWRSIVERYAIDKSGSLTLSDNYIPEGRLLSSAEPVWQNLTNLGTGALSNVIDINQTYHVLQVVDRVPRGTPPRLVWIQNEIRELLRIQARKQAYYSYVQNLKNEAVARRDLFIVEPDRSRSRQQNNTAPPDTVSLNETSTSLRR